jgi:hypothetical protein
MILTERTASLSCALPKARVLVKSLEAAISIWVAT